MARPTILDIAKHNGTDSIVGLIDETTKAHPEVREIAARTVEGLNYRTKVRTGLFDGSTFRLANEGITVGKGQYENRLVETYIVNPRWEADKAVADAHEDGADVFMDEEGESMVEKAMVDMARQFYYGATSNGNAKGYPGLLQAYDATNMVVDAGGTTASTGSSVWLIKTGTKDVQWVFGRNGEMMMPERREETIYDSNDLPLPGYVQDLLIRPGLQVGSVRGIVRIKKITADSGKTLTDALLASAIGKFEAGIRPDMILMSRRSLTQLQASRTVTLMGVGTTAPDQAIIAPRPVAYGSIPIFETDAILDTESLTL